MLKRCRVSFCFALFFLAVQSQAIVMGAESGRLREQDGIRVLQLWGTDEERGIAQGRLLGDEIAIVLDLLIKNGIEGGKDGYEKVLIPFTKKMHVQAQHLAEMHGMIKGMSEKSGTAPQVPALGRPMTFDDLMALNCIPDVSPVACSSLMAWGRLTSDFQTIGGRNLDWHMIPGLTDHQLLVVNALPADSQRASWVSVTVPGFIGCLTGLSKDGVVVAMHDVLTGKPWVDGGFCPRGIALRDAIEAAKPYTETRDIQAILLARPTAVGNLVPVFYPSRPRSTASPGVVFEYDGHSGFADRVTVGVIKGHEFGIGTNHYRIKSKETPSCDRFDKLFAELSAMESKGEKLTVEKTWSLLEAVAQPRAETPKLQTYHSVVIEPAIMKMHVALARGDNPAAQSPKVTIDAGALLKEAIGTSK